MGKGMCPVAGRACQVAGVDEGCGIGNVNDWVVGTKTGAITNWTSNASMPKGLGWCYATQLFGELTLGNLTDADFAYPKFCDDHECNAEVVKQVRRLW